MPKEGIGVSHFNMFFYVRLRPVVEFIKYQENMRKDVCFNEE